MIFGTISRTVSGWMADYLQKPTGNYEPISVTPPDRLIHILEPGDILLVEGKSRISGAIKFLTQSTWSHAAIYVGDALETPDAQGNARTLIEADIKAGVIAVPLSKYFRFNTRICRPVGIGPQDMQQMIAFLADQIGGDYDLKNVVDLARYLLPKPPVPVRFRPPHVGLRQRRSDADDLFDLDRSRFPGNTLPNPAKCGKAGGVQPAAARRDRQRNPTYPPLQSIRTAGFRSVTLIPHRPNRPSMRASITNP